MRLELNTTGAWRTVLTGLGQHDEDQLIDARTAATVLAEISNPGRERRGGITLQMDSGMKRIEIARMLERFARAAREDARFGGDE